MKPLLFSGNSGSSGHRRLKTDPPRLSKQATIPRRIAVGAPSNGRPYRNQGLALLGVGQLEADAHMLGGADHLVEGERWPSPAPRCPRSRAQLKIFGLDDLNVDSGLDGSFEQLFQPLLAQGVPEATDLRRVAGQTILVVIHAAEKLPQHVLAPTESDPLIAEVEAVLEVEQAGQ